MHHSYCHSGKRVIRAWGLLFAILLICLAKPYRIEASLNDIPGHIILKLQHPYSIADISHLQRTIYSWHEQQYTTPNYPTITPIQESFRPGETDQSHYLSLVYSNNVDLSDMIPFLENQYDVVYAERNRRLGRKEASRETDMGEKVYIPETEYAWVKYLPKNNHDVIVAILDTGVNVEHVSFTFWKNPGEIPNDGIDNDGNGLVDDIVGWDFSGVDSDIEEIGDNDVDDQNGHGSLVAGIAAMKPLYRYNVAGVNPGAPIMALKVFYDDRILGSDLDLAQATRYAVDMAAAEGKRVVLNMSFGGGSTLFREAVSYAIEQGAIVVTSAGNTDTLLRPTYFDNVIAVGNMEKSKELGNSNYFGPEVDFIAYGTLVRAASKNGVDNPASDTGTSMASPMIAGLISRLLQFDKTLTLPEIMSLLESHAVQINGGSPTTTGHGYIDVEALVKSYGVTVQKKYVDVELDEDIATLEFDLVYHNGDLQQKFMQYIYTKDGRKQSLHRELGE